MKSSFRLLLQCAGLLFGLAAASCGQTTQAITLRSLESNGEVSFLCLNDDFSPRSINDCPDQSHIDNEARRLYTLVTQTTRGEVALVDLTAGTVVDEDQTIPGFSFLPIGAQPTSIVSTPGSVASFVAVAEVGKEGIFGLPTSCVKPRTGSAPVRDVTTWPACRLPSTPGEMTLLVDPPGANGVIRPSCPGAPSPPKASTTACPADLATETVEPGRRKLAVELPDKSEIAIVDAQALLDRQPGSFDPCPIERYVPLEVKLPATPIAEQLPPDLDTGYVAPGLIHGPDPDQFVPHPAGLANLDDPITDEHRLFVADLNAPVIHVLDTHDPCSVSEAPPLLPQSYLDPARVVTTSRVAASPLTTDEKRYLYAVDVLGGGSVMIFDVSPGAANRTPLVRPRSPLLPFEPPDRIAFDAPARDVTFALRDHVQPDPTTGTGQVGVFCDPNPNLPLTAPGAAYRPAVDLSSGAIPGNLRGVFGFVALDSGQISVIDVEDFDAPCRRPETLNTSSVEDFHGCSDDPSNISSYVVPASASTAATPTVTNEVSCHMVEPNRARSSLAMLNDPDVGVRAPSLRSLPRLVSEDGRTLLTDRSANGLVEPRMLGVNFSNSAAGFAQVYVGTTLFETPRPKPGPQLAANVEDELVIDPSQSQQNSLVLSFAEPRAYAPQEDFTATYEGPLIDERPSATFAYQNGTATLTDGGIVFCDAGVQDENVAKDRGASLNVEGASLGAFGVLHADHVQILSNLLDESDSWWTKGNPGATCGGADPNQAGAGFTQCDTSLGTHDQPGTLRDLHIQSAARNTLVVTPRNVSPGSAESTQILQFLQCCFPQTVSYAVRSSAEWVIRGSLSGFRHDITTAPNGQCVRDHNPLRSHLSSRVQEVSCSDGCGKDAAGQPAVGPPIAGEVACIFDAAHPPPQTMGDPGSACIYQGLTTSFVIYSGQPTGEKPSSVLDDAFNWTVFGGFSPLLVDLAAANDANTSPSSIVFSPQLGGLVVADGSQKGLLVIDLATLALSQYL